MTDQMIEQVTNSFLILFSMLTVYRLASWGTYVEAD